MKTRKQILKEFLDTKAKSMVITDKSAKKTDSKTLKSFYKALADRDNTTLRELQGDIAKAYEEKALGDGQNITNTGDGGYLVPVELADAIREQLAYISPIRQIATVIANIPPVLEIPFEDAIPTTYWVGEGEAPTKSKSTFKKITLTPHKLGGFGKFSHESLVDTATSPSLQDFVAKRFALSLAQKENDAFVNGDGSDKPFGFRSSQITPKTDSVATSGKLGYQDLVKAFYGVHPVSRANGIWVMPTEAISKIVGLVDAQNRPLYVPAMSENAPATILGKAVYEVPEVPTNLGAATNETEIWFGASY